MSAPDLARFDATVKELTLEEKVSLLAGSDWWHTPGVERLGILPIKVSDGPCGARGRESTGGPRSANFPCGTALASTWDVDLVHEVGQALGQETKTKGAHVLLAPTVNIHRSPLAGRNFECYSEDPFLSARMAVAYITGVQSQGVGTSVKHFVANDSEFERHTISSEVDERTLREISLVPFEAAITEAQSWSIMSAYNKINGTYAADHHELLTTILKDEWGFDGFVVSDWFGSQSTVDAANAGLDLEMPGPPRWWGQPLLDAVQAGDVAEAVIDDKVRRLLLLRERAKVTVGPTDLAEGSENRPEHQALARRAATEAFVLLKNDGDALPLDLVGVKTVALIGPNAGVARIQGGGSARVRPHYAISPLAGLRAAVADRTGVTILHEPGCSIDRSIPMLDTRLAPEGLTLELFANPDFEGEPIASTPVDQANFTWWGAAPPEIPDGPFSARLTATIAPTESGAFTFSLTSAGPSRLLLDEVEIIDNRMTVVPGEAFFGRASGPVNNDVELVAGQPRELVVEFSTGPRRRGIHGLQVGVRPQVPTDLIDRAVRAAANADVAVVVVGSNDEWETEGRDRADMELPGDQAELIARVAAANPHTVVVINAGSPVTMDWASDVSAILQIWYPGQELGNALADVLSGVSEPGGRLPTTFPVRLEDTPAFTNYPGERGRVVYGEGVFVGYRWYDARDIEPLFPFGHGLSYTTFEYGEVRLSATELDADDPIVTVAVDVTNTGAPGARSSRCTSTTSSLRWPGRVAN